MSSVSSWLTLRPGRGAAFAIHLTLSLLVFSTLVAVMLVYWFPGDLFIMDGGWEGLKLVAMVDLVLGPALTLILFKPGKPGLKFDLSVIAAVQIAALAYGFHTTYNQRTVAVVFAENEFATVSAKDMTEADTALVALDETPEAVPQARAFQVPLRLTPAPENFGKYLQGILNGYPGAHHRSDQYVELAPHHDELKKGQLSIQQLQERGALAEVEAVASERNLNMDEIEIYNFRARYANGYALYNPETSRIIDYVRHTPADKTQSVAGNGE